MNHVLPRGGLLESTGLALRSPSRAPALVDFQRWAVQLRSGSDSALTRLPLPLFWHDPPWHHVTRQQAGQEAAQATGFGVTVAALQSEVGSLERLAPRLCPYRPDRYGLAPSDLDQAAAIDLRLAAPATGNWPARYQPEQLSRWAIIPEKVNPTLVMDAPHWPADVRDPMQLRDKVQQLRVLTGGRAAIWLTIDLLAWPELRSSVQAAVPDVLCFQARGRRATAIRQTLQGIGRERTMRFAIVADITSPLDVAMLWALGADLVGIDGLVEDVLQPSPKSAEPASGEGSLFSLTMPAPAVPPVVRTQAVLRQLIDDLASLVSQLGAISPQDACLPQILVEG